ncbi:alkaline phosphatase D family protein [Phytoactinopolyspora halotolerans]|uniref:Alkaline phosphatase family protein n=1 Tax=Phytoactinopolyspora halotolerans TaxID=1981512 RepID=A0A6L9SHI9_9ACTN|nr:alkaline phosphatase D family protein [Phytoactinopolyspora halotolerans]NEE04597.1 alkaline phosphatase family protein [Phytoactinopolyspora halotolerans]
MARLLLGPIVRAAHRDRVTVWVETDEPCEVTVGPQTSRTVTLLGHHYAFVAVDGLGTATPYTVALDGEQVWPADGADFPPSVLRALPDDRLRLVFGSCRTILPDENGDSDRIDALRECALRCAGGDSEDLPDVLVLLGDQVYADEGAPATRRFVRRRRRTDGPVGAQTHTFAEFAALYREAWSDPAVRWLLSTVPTLMIFDDHEIIDNWNTSEQWLAEHQAQPWWRQRLTNGLAAYWIYQHMGNLLPEERETDAAFAALSGGDESVALDVFDTRATHGALGTKGTRWSYVRALGPARLVMLDSRDGRVLADGQRHMLDEDGWELLEREVNAAEPYLLVGTSLPLLLPSGLFELERLVTAACSGRWGRAGVRIGEEIRQAAQFTHWATFPGSFTRALQALRTAGDAGRKGVIVLSGDVHFSYDARVSSWADGTTPRSPTHQLVSSPLCHDLHGSIIGGVRALVSRPGRFIGRLAARAAGRRRSALRWTIESGPWLHNVISTLDLGPDGASVRVECTRTGGRQGERLETVAEHLLT